MSALHGLEVSAHTTMQLTSLGTWPMLFTPAVHSSPSLPTSSEWFLPQAAETNLVPLGAPRSVALSFFGTFSEMKSVSGTPNAAGEFRPNNQAVPSMSNTIQ